MQMQFLSPIAVLALGGAFATVAWISLGIAFLCAIVITIDATAARNKDGQRSDYDSRNCSPVHRLSKKISLSPLDPVGNYGV